MANAANPFRLPRLHPRMPTRNGDGSILPRGKYHDRDVYPLAEVGAAGVQCGVPGDAELAAVDSGLGPEGGRDFFAEGVHALTEEVGVEDNRLGDAMDGEGARWSRPSCSRGWRR